MPVYARPKARRAWGKELPHNRQPAASEPECSSSLVPHGAHARSLPGLARSRHVTAVGPRRQRGDYRPSPVTLQGVARCATGPASRSRHPRAGSDGRTNPLRNRRHRLSKSGRTQHVHRRPVGPTAIVCLTATCDKWENGKSISSIDTGHASIEHGAKTNSDLARPPGGDHPATQQAGPGVLTRNAARRGRSAARHAHSSPSDSE
jgi:hypothetical protein